MLFKLYESTEGDRRTLQHEPSGTHWSTSSDTRLLVQIKKEMSPALMWYEYNVPLVELFFRSS